MTFPKVTETCLSAILDKATQQAPDKFAKDVMIELMSGQPVLMEAITTVMQPFLSTLGDNEVDGHELDDGMRQEILIMAHFCVLGITLRAINAQVEADEMNEVWA